MSTTEEPETPATEEDPNREGTPPPHPPAPPGVDEPAEEPDPADAGAEPGEPSLGEPVPSAEPEEE